MCTQVSLVQQLTTFMQGIAHLTFLPLIHDIDLAIIARLEEDAYGQGNSISEYAREISGKIRRQLKKLTPDNIDAQRAIYNAFAEARIFYSILSKTAIERIKESDSSTPDFRMDFNGEPYYAEIKALSMAGSDAKYRTIAEDHIDANIEIEEQLRMGRRVASSITAIQPAKTDKREYDWRSIRAVVELLIEKAESLFKPGQFRTGPTIMFLDVSQWALGCTAEEGALKYFIDHMTNSNVSGPLWHAVFGEVGSPIVRAPEFEGKSNSDGYLEREGLMRHFPDIKGIVFCYAHGPSAKLVGFVRSTEHKGVKCLLRTITDLLNDETDASNR